MQDLSSWSFSDHERMVRNQPRTIGRILSMISRQLGPLVAHYAMKDWNPAASASSPCSRNHMHIWSLPMIQRRTGWKCCGQMRPKSSSLASTQLVVFGGMLPMTPRTPSPPSSMEVETLVYISLSSQSPDLNPIENLWRELKVRINEIAKC